MNAKSSIFTDTRLFQLIVEASPSGMVIADSQGEIILVNPQALEWFGYSEQELLGMPVEILIPDAHHGAHVTHRARYLEHPQPRTMAAGRDLFARRKDGSTFPVDISLHPLESESGRLVLANIVDATGRKQAEKDRDARQAMQRLALLGQLAGGVAHEIRTPLCVIGNDVYFLQTLSDRLGDEGVECIREIKESVGKANRIVSELLDFTRDPASSLEKAPIDEIISAAIETSALPAGVVLRRAQVDDELIVLADREQIERVLINLLRNAVQALECKGEIEIAIQCTDEEVSVTVSDDGPGIAAEHSDQVFEPLFTTKPKGIGLGLAVSRRYAERNQGSLTLDTPRLGGATFRLALPRTENDPFGRSV